VVDGRLAVPEGPGLGITVDEAKVRDLSARTWDSAALR
jgi:L-alanine-DL-glutamate epimerase-like enolase superfamily enzyme